MSKIITDLAWFPPAFPAQGRLPTKAALVGKNCAQQDNHELTWRQGCAYQPVLRRQRQ
ncbi:hypothetical protein N7977_05760 [Pantoea dispersa]|nr:hypothetical protein [Pantoea dispersa]UXO69512.1 hypothetical protein N7977_05760 [Pantoea dispersa]